MKSFSLAAAISAVSLVSANPTQTEKQQPNKRASLPAVTVSGNAFWSGSTRFYVRGIDYQPGGASAGIDPLADTTVCKRDIAKFKDLGVNTIRVYITDNSANHDECMNALADAGIYAIIDANNPKYSIHRYEPGPSYNEVYLQSVFATIDNFAKYTNTLAFFSGNEVINENVTSTEAARYVKATTRDMRQYIGNRQLRKIPVGYSAADVSENRKELAEYMNCGTDDERSDFFAFNDYSWCSSNFKTSGWDQKVKNFTDYGIAIFLSEYGCNTNERDFAELGALMSTDMSAVYSGGLMFEYTQEENDYGIVDLKDGQVTDRSEFKAFKAALAKYSQPSGAGGASPTTKATKSCPTKNSVWLVDSTLLPAIPEGAKKYMTEGAGKGPGLKGDGSQKAKGTSTGDAKPGSGAASVTAAPDNKNAGMSMNGPVDKAPFVITGVVFFFSLFGAMLL